MIRIDVLPDDVLLDIFHFYVMKEDFDNHAKKEVEAWQSLVHVCRRWRSVVFGSPHRLNLQLYCTAETLSRSTLDVWPALPLIIYGDFSYSGVGDVIVALGHRDRVCVVHLAWIRRRQLEEVLALMQVPFPELTNLWLSSSYDETMPVIPDSFLGGSVPSLRVFDLTGIPFPILPKLLLSATRLVELNLFAIPHSGYIPPEAMVALLSVLSSLERLSLQFDSPYTHPDLESRQPPPLKLSIIPSLTRFSFKGASEYLEDLVTCIDAPQLDDLEILFFDIDFDFDFDTPQFAQFINRTPIFGARYEARVGFDDEDVHVKLLIHSIGDVVSDIGILCREPDWQLSAIAQVCNSSLPALSTVEDLHIELGHSLYGVWKNDTVDHTLWLELLLPFLAVKDLYLPKECAPGVAAALQELVGGRITEVLPSLRNIFVKGIEPRKPFREDIGKFVAARRLSGHPVAISVWSRGF
jgi:hypothetical protein